MCLLLFKDGELVKKNIGFINKTDLKEWLK